MKAVVYTRVSADAQGTARSVAEQEAECLKVCDRSGWNVVEVFCDNDVSASRFAKQKSRPDWERLMLRLGKGDIGVLVVWELSRTTRDRVVWATLVDRCIEAGVSICVDGKLSDLSDPDAAFELDLQALLGVREAGVTQKRVLRAISANADAGRPHGKIPFGYAREYDRNTGALVAQVIREDQAVLVRDIVGRVADGDTLYSICTDYNTRGIPTPRGGPEAQWVPSTIRRIASNPAYISKRVHQGRLHGEANWPPIVDEKTFFRAKVRLDDPARRTTRTTRLRYLLSGIAKAPCGGKIRVLDNRGAISYVCQADFCVSRKVLLTDSVVREHIIKRLGAGDLEDIFAPGRPDEHEPVKPTESVADLTERLSAYAAQAALPEGDPEHLSPRAFTAVTKTLEASIDQAEERARLAEPVAIPPAITELSVATDKTAAWDALDIGQQREVIRALATVTILQAGKGRRIFDPTLIRVDFPETHATT